jgi:hypothetical protein
MGEELRNVVARRGVLFRGEVGHPVRVTEILVGDGESFLEGLTLLDLEGEAVAEGEVALRATNALVKSFQHFHASRIFSH